MICGHSKICSVCNWIDLSADEQKTRKINSLMTLLEEAQISPLPAPEFYHVADQALRDRADLVWSDGKLGFYQKDSRDGFQVEACPLMSPALTKYFQEIRKMTFPLQKGSLRLRVSHDGKHRGIWLDFANEDIRDLLTEKKTLQALLDLGFVEIGQRRKSLAPEMKLKDPQYNPWSRTWIQDQPAELYSVVGGFTQSGDLANRILVQTMQKFFAKAKSQQWVEFGAGNGNLTLPLVASQPDRHVKALEFDELSLEGLKRSLENHPNLAKRIDLQSGDFQRRERYRFQSDEGILVNPPRSGLMKFLDPLFEIQAADRPREFLYMSCHPDSFTKDGIRMKELGYKIESLAIVDQFPHSPHFEILSYWNLDI